MSSPLPIGSEKIKHRLFAVGLAGFLGALAIGVDGHPIFQILAAESLGLGPRAVGIALGLGTLSIPIQIWAARIPLHRARHNIRLYLWSIGVMTMLTAALVAFARPGSWVAALALAVAIVAEVSVSVLMATAWQPVISYSLTPVQRAFMLGPAAAIRGLVILGSTVLIGALDRTGRSIFLVVVAVVVLVTAETLRALPPPPESGIGAGNSDPELSRPVADRRSTPRPDNSPPPEIMSLYIMTVGLGVGRWPLLVTYASVKLWPTGNLGLLGAALAAGYITASSLWRDPGRWVLRMVRIGVAVIVLCTVALVTIEGPISSTSGAAVLFLLAAVVSAANSVTGTAAMELVHRRVDTTSSVRVMTMLDVIGSTTAQLNMFVAGFLIAASTSGAVLMGMDVYQLWILVMVLVPAVAAVRLRLLPGDLAPESVSVDESDSDTHPA